MNMRNLLKKMYLSNDLCASEVDFLLGMYRSL